MILWYCGLLFRLQVLSLWAAYNVQACSEMAIARGENVTFGSINVNDCVLPIAEGTPNKTYLNWYAFVGGLTVVFVTIRGLVSASVVAPSIRVWMHCSWSWSLYFLCISSLHQSCCHSCMVALFLVLVNCVSSVSSSVFLLDDHTVVLCNGRLD